MKKILLPAILAIVITFGALSNPAYAAEQTQQKPHIQAITNHQSLLVTELIKVTATQTGQTIRQVTAQLKEGKSLAQVAEAAGKSAADILDAARRALKTRLDKAVKAKRLTQTKADKQLTQFDQDAPGIMQNSNLFPQATPDIATIIKRARQMVLADLVKTTIEQTKLTRKQVLAQLKDGKSLEQIAQAAGTNPSDIVAAVRNDLKSALDQAISKKQISQLQANFFLAQYDQEVPTAMQDTALWKKL